MLERLEPSPERDVLIVSLRSDEARARSAMEGFTDDVESAYERLLASLDGAEVPQVYPVLRTLAAFYSFRSENGRAAEVGRQLLDVGERTGDPAIRVEGHLFHGTGLSFLGRVGDGIPELEAGVATWKAHPYQLSHLRLGPDPRVSTLSALSLLGWWEGSIDRSLERSREALAMAAQLEHPSTSGYALHHASLLRLWRDEPAEARELAVRVIEVADEHELPIWSAVGTVILGAAAVAIGIGEEGLRWISEGLDRYRGMRTPPVFWPFLLHVRAQACQRAGRLEDGLESVREGLAAGAAAGRPAHRARRPAAGRPRPGRCGRPPMRPPWTSPTGGGRGRRSCGPPSASAELEAPAGVLEDRRARLRSLVETFAEGLGSPDVLAARTLLSGE